MTAKLVFVGSNANLLQMADIAKFHGYDDLSIIDQDYHGNTDFIDGIPVIGSELDHDWQDGSHYFLAVNWFPGQDAVQSRNRVKRRRLVDLLCDRDVTCINLIHPSAVIAPTATLGQGIMVGAGAIIGNHVQIDDFAQVREHSYLAHHCRLGASAVVQVYAYIGSHVRVGAECYIGVRASCITQHSEIPAYTFVKSHILYQVDQ